MRIFFFIVMMFCSHSQATEKTLKIAVNLGPPWAFYDQQQGVTGVDVEIMRHIFSQLGYATEFHLVAYNRLIKDFNQSKFDVASPAAFPVQKGFLTKPYLPFQDVVVSLEQNQLTIDQLTDLRGKSIVAYQFATSVLGSDFANTVKQANYIEIAKREVQLTLLVNGRTEVVVGERRLLTHIMNKLYPEHQLAVHPIFESQSYGAIIHDQQLQQDFDQTLAKMKASGKFAEIIKRWP